MTNNEQAAADTTTAPTSFAMVRSRTVVYARQPCSCLGLSLTAHLIPALCSHAPALPANFAARTAYATPSSWMDDSQTCLCRLKAASSLHRRVTCRSRASLPHHLRSRLTLSHSHAATLIRVNNSANVRHTVQIGPVVEVSTPIVAQRRHRDKALQTIRFDPQDASLAEFSKTICSGLQFQDWGETTASRRCSDVQRDAHCIAFCQAWAW